MKLTPSQHKATTLRGRHILVSAGAGTGKTRVLVERVVDLIMRESVPLSEILILTFTEKAAGEIKQRLAKRFREKNLTRARQDLEAAAIGTFHGFAARLLREHPVEAGVDPDFRVLENEESELFKEEALEDCINRFFETASPVFRFFETYGEAMAREAILHVYHTARQEGVDLKNYFEKWRKERAEKIKNFADNLPMQAASFSEPVADKMNIAEWTEWLHAENWSWEKDAQFHDWLKACGRSPKLTPFKNFAKEWASFRMEELAETSLDLFEQAAVSFEAAYAQRKQTENGLDFDDLQTLAMEFLRGETPGHRVVGNILRRSFRHVFVDEFQDTSYLQVEFVRFLMPHAEVFLVGDYKQSIYSFRGAEPQLFLDTEEVFKQSKIGERILLADNFRSGSGVLDFANGFFEKIWEEDNFPFEKLKAGKADALTEKESQKPEYIVIPESDDGSKAEDRLREGAAIAARIREFHRQGIPYGDMAILFSGMTHSALYEYSLRKAGIPYLSISGMSFYDQPEIRDVISFLECLQNPLADVPLAAVLRSPFVRVSDETLFWLTQNAKKETKRNPLFEGLLRFREINEISETDRARLTAFFAHFENWRLRKDALRISELLEEVIEKTGYAVWALAQPSGVRRYGHVRKLIQLIRRQESRGCLSIHGLLARLRRLQFQEVRETDSAGLNENIQAVRLMTVHAAKGLEFPVVFAADLGRDRHASQMHPALALPYAGFALRLKNPITGESETPWFFAQLDQTRKKRENGERKRLFYVAVTRAATHLVLSGVWKTAKKEKETFAEMSSWMDWVMTLRDLAAERSPESLLPVSDISGSPAAPAQIPRFQVWLDQLRGGKDAELQDVDESSPLVKTILERVHKSHQPEFAKVIDLPVSAYVLFSKNPEEFWSVYGRGWKIPEWESFEQAPATPESRGEDAADFGTRMHRALEFLDWKQPLRSLDPKNLDAMFSGLSDQRRKEATEILACFIKTELFSEVKKSKVIRRELDFVLNARRGLIDGVIDLLYQNEDGTFTVLDYKTATGDEKKTKTSGYDLQIQIYALAAAKILKQPISRACVYYLKNQTAVNVTLGDLEQTEAYVNGIQQQMLEFVKVKLGFLVS